MDMAVIDIRKMRAQEELYIAYADRDFSWTKAEMQEVIQGWEQGVHISDIAKRIHRDADEVAILIMDLVRQKRIKTRKGGAFGWG